MLENYYEKPEPLRKHKWTCKRDGCPNPNLENYSLKGLDTLIRLHEIDHDRQQRLDTIRFDMELSRKPKDYNILKITRVDIGFLRTRGIAIDDDMELV